MTLIHFAIILPIIFAFIIGVFSRFYKRDIIGWIVLPVPFLITVYLFTLIPTVSSGQNIYLPLNVMPKVGMNFDVYIDGLSLLFGILISGIGTLVVLYSIGYLSKKEQLTHFYIYLLMFMTAMLGVVMNDNVLSLYLFWELTSISSFLLIAFWYKKDRSLYGAQKSMLITMFGGFMMLGGFLILSVITDTLSIREMIENVSFIQQSEFTAFAIILILLGAFTKSAQFPFYIWLPDAMEAPTPVSAYLHSATMVKAGIYLVSRLTPLFAFHGLWVWIILLGGLITLFWASFNAVKQDDLKGVLAFSTVSQLGMIMSLLGAGALSIQTGANDALFTVAIVAAVFHLINHATFKGALFMITGIIDHETGTRSLKKLGGLLTVMPISATLTIITSLSMAGLPPFNGFLSKELFLEAIIDLKEANFSGLQDFSILFPLLAIVGSIFTFIYSILIIKGVFFGKRTQDTPKDPHEAGVLLLISPIILSALVLVFGLFPNILSGTLIDPAAMAIMNSSEMLNTNIYHWHGFDSPALWATIAIVLIGTLLFMTRSRWMFIYDYHKTGFTFNYLYDQSLVYSQIGSKRLNDKMISGDIRRVILITFLFLIVYTITTFLQTGLALDFSDTAPVTVQEMIIIGVIVVAVSVILVVKSRMVAVIMLGAVGFSISLLFVIFRAADLGLTQLSIEAITTVLILIVLSQIPTKESYRASVSLNIPHLIVSIGVGISVALIGLSAYSNRLFESISQFHIDNVYELGAGGNMVNVILVDFRGFDTLFETLVLGITGIGVYCLIRLRLNRKDGKHEERIDESGV